MQRGPAYTEMSLFARINEDGKLTLVNHLGIDLGETPEQILSKLDDDRIKDDDVRHDTVTPTIMTMSTAFVILKPTRPHVITPIRIGYLNLLVAPGSW